MSHRLAPQAAVDVKQGLLDCSRCALKAFDLLEANDGEITIEMAVEMKEAWEHIAAVNDRVRLQIELNMRALTGRPWPRER